MKTRSNNFDASQPLNTGVSGFSVFRTRARALTALRSVALMTAVLLSSGARAAEASGATNSYDWSVLIAAGFGLLGLIWIRRHVSRL